MFKRGRSAKSKEERKTLPIRLPWHHQVPRGLWQLIGRYKPLLVPPILH